MNYKCVVSYKGTNYYGWAKQKDLPTIELMITNAFKDLFDINVTIFGSGRTDRYVHALAQVFSVKHKKLNLSASALMNALNAKLPEDIRILECTEVDEKFHARFSAKNKTYIYKLSTNSTSNLFLQDLIYQYNQPIDFDKFEQYKQKILGEHNFLSFSTSEIENTIREVYEFDYEIHNGVVNFKITGNGFLRNMVRMIIGCFLNYNEDKITLNDVQFYLDNPKKGQVIKKVNGCGLYLYKVEYI